MPNTNLHTINTRIKLRYDTYENWIKNDPVLLAGEVAVATVAANDAEGKPGFQNLPNVVIKVGDGSSKYSALKFVSGLAADVHDWAKATEKPEYQATEIKGLETYIGEKVQDTNTQYTIVKVNDYQYKLQKKELGEESFADTGVVIDLPNDTAAISALQGKFEGMTEATVVAHVAAEIAKLNIGNYALKTEVQAVQKELTDYQTSNDQVIEAIKDHATVDSFADVMTEMAKYQIAGDYATKAEAKGYADAKDSSIAMAQGTANNAANNAAEALGQIDMLSQTVGQNSAKLGTLVGSDVDKSVRTIAAEEAAKKDQAIADAAAAAKAAQDDVDAVEQDLGNVDGLSTENKTIVGAINEVLTAVGTGGTAAVVTMTTDTTTDGALKSYTIKQGTTTVGVIDIPKDMVVESGEVVTNPEGQTAGTYIKLKLANVTDPLYINVGTLVDIYKAKAEATQVQVTIDSATREISAAIVAGSVTSTELADNAVVTAKIADANVTKAKLSTEVQASLGKADAAAPQTALDAEIERATKAEAQALTNAKAHSDAELAKEAKRAGDAEAALAERLDDVEALLGEGEGSVADQIAAAKDEAIAAAQTKIEALDVEDTAVAGQFVTRVSETDGKIAVERAAITTDHLTQGAKTLVFDCGSSAI